MPLKIFNLFRIERAGSAMHYRSLAKESLGLADTVPPHDKPVVVKIAKAWEELAKDAERSERVATDITTLGDREALH